MKESILALALIAVVTGAYAQNSTTSQQESNSTAQNSGVSNSTVINTLPNSPYTQQEVNSRFNTNQAMSAPAVIGSAAPSTGGCPAIEGWSASLVGVNGGKSNVVELPGCMANQLADRVGRLQTNTDGTWTWAAVMQLEAWCSYPLYKTILERSSRYTCQETTEAQRAQHALVLAKPQYTDPIVRARLGLPPLK